MPGAIAKLLPFLLVLLSIYGAAWLFSHAMDGSMGRLQRTTQVFISFLILVAAILILSRLLFNS